ncbi:DUF7660 family protein [Streptomyces atratus]|uniref:DUF7660 family protein n=1 Tax=Streptomyces atratus TaxID=1893 RepID=UPI00340003E9
MKPAVPERGQQGLGQLGHQWENLTPERFLEALEAWVAGAPGWYRTFGHKLTFEGDWTFFARALTAARIYE